MAFYFDDMTPNQVLCSRITSISECWCMKFVWYQYRQ